MTPKFVVDLNPETGEVEEFFYEEEKPAPPLVRPKVKPRKRPNGAEPDAQERERRRKN